MESESDEVGTSITHLFVRERFGEVDFERHLFDGITQKLYESFVSPLFSKKSSSCCYNHD